MFDFSTLSNLSLSELPSSFDRPIRLTVTIIIVLFAYMVISTFTRRLRIYLENMPESVRGLDSKKRVLTLVRVLRYVLVIVLMTIAVISILGDFGVQVAPILGAAGVVGIAVGFGAQSLIKDYLSGFFLLLENQIRIGDVVEAGGKSGVVEELTLRYLRLRDYEGIVHFVPNGQITVVSNMTMEFAYAPLEIGIAYKENIDQAIDCMRRTYQQIQDDELFGEKIIQEIEIAGVNTLGDFAVTIKARIKVKASEQWAVRREFLKRIKIAFDQEGIEIPFPHRKVINVSG